jgi:hypothetical protein
LSGGTPDLEGTTVISGTIFCMIACMLQPSEIVTPADSVELTIGPDVSVSYDPAVWKPLAPLRRPEPGVCQSMTWSIEKPEWLQISVRSSPERKTEAEFKREILVAQKFRGDPAELVGERRATVSNWDWQVLEFTNSNTQPQRTEIHYFLQTADGNASLFVICDKAHLAGHREAIETFLGNMKVK